MSEAAEQWDQRQPGPQQGLTSRLPWPSPGGPGGTADPTQRTCGRSSGRLTGYKEQADGQTGSLTHRQPRGRLAPETTPLHPHQSLGRAWAHHTGGGSGPPLPSFFLPPVSLCSGGLARAEHPSTASPDHLAAPGLAPCPALAPDPQIRRGGWGRAGWMPSQLGRLVSKLTIRHNGENVPFVNTWSI